MRVLAISDLHVDYPANRAALAELGHHEEDWLLVGGDVSHDDALLDETLRFLAARFRRVVWVPGNHELWTVSRDPRAPRGEARYRRLVELAREAGALTPEDPWPELAVEGTPYVVAPLFLLYDYSFRPDRVPFERAVEWAAEAGLRCTDEVYLHCEPFASRAEWCHARCDEAEARLAQVPAGRRLVLLNHFPLREDLVRINIPRFRIWCGTKRTEDWHRRYDVASVVTGHLHVRTTTTRDGVRFEEVSLGYPRHWRRGQGVEHYLRQVLPPLRRPLWYWP